MGITTMSTLTKKGQATIPKRIREYLRLKPKDKVEFEIKQGEVRIKPASDLESNFGRVKPKRRPEDFKAQREFFQKKVGEETAKES